MTRVIIVVLAALAMVQASAQQSPKIQEKYECRGTSSDGDYQLSLAIEAKGENYFLSWDEGLMRGLGIRSKNILSAVFVNTHTGAIGVVLYEVQEGQLFGLWPDGNGRVYKENCLAGKQAKGGQDGYPQKNTRTPTIHSL